MSTLATVDVMLVMAVVINYIMHLPMHGDLWVTLYCVCVLQRTEKEPCRGGLENECERESARVSEKGN